VYECENYKLRSKEIEQNEEMNYLEAIKRLKKKYLFYNFG